jgi:hypothetical protein
VDAHDDHRALIDRGDVDLVVVSMKVTITVRRSSMRSRRARCALRFSETMSTATVDPSLGNGGRATPVYGPAFAGATFPTGTVGADGSIVVNRQNSYDGEGFVTVERYLADGRLDPSFKAEDKDELVEVEDAQGRTLRTARTKSPTTIERLNSDGSVDQAFGCDSPTGPCRSIADFAIEAILPLPSGRSSSPDRRGRRGRSPRRC